MFLFEMKFYFKSMYFFRSTLTLMISYMLIFTDMIFSSIRKKIKIINKNQRHMCPEELFQTWITILDMFTYSCPWYLPPAKTDTYRKEWYQSRGRVTKPIISIPLYSLSFGIIGTQVICRVSCLYLTGVTTAELQRHLANINLIWKT